MTGVGKGGRVSNFDFIGFFIMEFARRKGLPLKRKIEIYQEAEKNPTKQKKTIAEEYKIAPSHWPLS